MPLILHAPDKRPPVVAGYVNHAFIVGDDVFEANPLQVRTYRINNVKARTSSLSPASLKQIATEVGEFIGPGEQPVRQEP